MKTKHTPGPWEIMTGLQDGIIVGADRKGVVDGDGFASMERTQEENQANARLIAASPELLEHSKYLLKEVIIDRSLPANL